MKRKKRLCHKNNKTTISKKDKYRVRATAILITEIAKHTAAKVVKQSMVTSISKINFLFSLSFSVLFALLFFFFFSFFLFFSFFFEI
jgi:hypothetical protein